MSGRHPSYLEDVVTPEDFRKIVHNVQKWLKKPGNKNVVAIAGRGISGIPLVGAIAYSTGLKPLYIRRNSHETDHDKESAVFMDKEKGKLAGRYIIVDDLIDTGDTVNFIVETVDNYDFFRNSRPKAILLYRHRGNKSQHYLCTREKVPLVFVGAGIDC